MALTTPILLSVNAFDATQSKVFEFSVKGGDQIVANRLQIILNDGTDRVVYDWVSPTYKPEHLLAARKLTNGGYYKARVATINIRLQQSNWSNVIQFRCFNIGEIDFTNIPVDNIINNSSFNFIAEYNKINAGDVIDSLQSYNFILYDSSNIEIGTTGVQYFSEAPDIPTIINHTFSGFVNNETYGIRVIVTTMYGMTLDTGVVQFSVDYIYPAAFSLLNLENVCDGGYIRIISDVSIIDGVAVPDPPTYIDGKEIDLRSDGSKVYWPEGWTVSGNFTLGIWGRQFNDNGLVALMNTNQSNYKIELYHHIGYPWDDDSEQKMYFDCYIYSGNDTPGYVYSNYIDVPDDDEEIYIWLARQDNILSLKILNRGVVT